MSCRRICRELLWLTRFGEVGPDSAPHLDHLSGCRACRDEVGFDRAMVERLRETLLARVADASPSDTAWANIVARAQAPETPRVRLWEWSTALVARLRIATGMAFTAFALILTLNTQLVPAGAPTASTDAAGESQSIGEGLTAGGRTLPPRSSSAHVRTLRPEPYTPQRVEPALPPPVGSQAAAATEVVHPATEDDPDDSFVLVFELIEQPAPVTAPVEAKEAPKPAPNTLEREPGEPS